MNIRLAPGPHIHTDHDTRDIMMTLIIALLFPSAAGIYFFGTSALWIIFVSVVSAVAAEWVWQKLAKKPVRINDLSAVVTGLILALNLPSTVPLWVPAVGSVFAIIIVKQLFGGIGHNFLNPAIAARAVLLASWPVLMTTWVLPARFIGSNPIAADIATFATPLASIKNVAGTQNGFFGITAPTYSWSLLDLFIGNIPGTIGETCKLAILCGLGILLITGVVKWHIPVVFVGTVAVFSWILGMNPLVAVLSGGVLFGAVFMATDYVTNPMLVKGRIIFAFGCGIIVCLIRRFGNYPEGVTYAILIMNIVTPLIDKYTKRKIYGEVKENA